MKCTIGFLPAVVSLLALTALSCAPRSVDSSQRADASPGDRSAASSTSGRSPASDKPADSVRAYIDPATGLLREPTAEDIAAEAAVEAAKKKTAGIAASKPVESREIVLPNGAIAIQLDESAQQPLVGCVHKDGAVKMDHECAENSDGAK